eukprot:scaffold83784_cov38-Attheya_sp.AAC.1
MPEWPPKQTTTWTSLTLAKGKENGTTEAAKNKKAQVTPEKEATAANLNETSQPARSEATSTPLPATPLKTTKEATIILTPTKTTKEATIILTTTPEKKGKVVILKTPEKQVDEEMPDTNPQQDLNAPPTPKRRNWNPETMEVEKSSKEDAVGKLKDIATKFFSVIQDADPTAILGNFTSSDNQRSLLLPAKTPTTITKLGQFFMRARPNPAGGVVYTAVRLAFNGDETNLMRNTELELSDLNIRLFRRPLQVQETVRKGWFCGVPSFVCTVALQSVLMAIMRKNQIKGLSEREIKEHHGTNHLGPSQATDGVPKWWTRQPKAIRIEFPKLQASKGTEELCKAIKSMLFESFYRGSIKYIPLFDYNVSDLNKQKIIKAITRHGHLEQSTEQFKIIGLMNMDSIDKNTGITVRQMAMTFLLSATNQKIPLILSLDPKFNDYETCIAMVPVKVLEESRELCVNFGANLMKKFEIPKYHRPGP